MGNPLKTPPAYAISSVDHALRIATVLQLEGALTVSEVAERLGVARSTAHRLLAMLVYRDFAVQREDRSYAAGPVLEIAAHSRSMAAQLREVGLPHLQRLTHLLHESANLTIRAGDTARFIASIESDQPLRVGSREGMVFPAHRTSGGMLLLAELDDQELDELYAKERYAERPGERPDLNALRRDLARVRQSGFAINKERSERGVIALGVPIRSADGRILAGLSISMPTVRYESENLISFLAALRAAATRLEADLAAQR
jgi:DNA-binding IclR family transcriptional regulator